MRITIIATVALTLGLIAGFILGLAYPSLGHPRYPSRSDVIGYLDGETIPATPPFQTAIMVKKDQIELLEIPEHAASVSDGPWRIDVTLVVRSDQGRCAIECTLMYRWVEKKCVFYGFKATAVTRL